MDSRQCDGFAMVLIFNAQFVVAFQIHGEQTLQSYLKGS
jgi:hypothetical protein